MLCNLLHFYNRSNIPLAIVLFKDSSIVQTKTDMIKVIVSKPFIDTLFHQLFSIHDVCRILDR